MAPRKEPATRQPTPGSRPSAAAAQSTPTGTPAASSSTSQPDVPPAVESPPIAPAIDAAATTAGDAENRPTAEERPPTACSDANYAEASDQLATTSIQASKLLAERRSLGGDAADPRRREIDREVEDCHRVMRSLELVLSRYEKTHAQPKVPATRSIMDDPAKLQLVKNLPKFRHGKDSVHDPDEFLAGLEKLLSDLAVDVGQAWRETLFCCLKAEDADWVKQETPADATWDDAKEAFLRCFGVPDRLYKARIALCRIRMGPGETLAAFTQRFKTLKHTGKWGGDVAAAALYRDCLPPSVREFVDTEMRKLGTADPTDQDMAKVVATSAWQPTTAKKPAPGGRLKPDSVVNKQQHCELHGACAHASEDCRVLQQRKTRAKPGAADARAATPSVTAPRPSTDATLKKPRCYICNQEGHLAVHCPKRQTAPANATVKHTVVGNDGDTPSASPAGQSTPRLRLLPVLLDDKELLAEWDTGASTALTSKVNAEGLGATIKPQQGWIQLAGGTRVPRIGTTSPVRVQIGDRVAYHEFEVMEHLDGPQVLIGNDLTDILGFMHIARLVEQYNQLGESCQAPVVDAPEQLAPADFSDEEQAPHVLRLREAFERATAAHLAANAAIPLNSFCPRPDAVVELPTEPGKTAYRRQYPLPQAQHAIIDEKLRAWLADGVIERVTQRSTFNAPFFLIPKKDASGTKTDFRLCVDFRQLNSLLPDDRWPLPLISDIFEAVAGAQVFTTLDLRHAYHRFPIAEKDRHKTGFTYRGTQYQYRGAPFGLKTMPSTFQRTMSSLLHELDYANVFIDDIVVASESWDDHAAHVNEVIRRLTEAKLILNVDKCHFARLEVSLLGFRINPYGRKIEPTRLASIEAWPTPRTPKQLRAWLGVTNYIRDHIPNIARLTAPLNAIRLSDKEDFAAQWTTECDQAVRLLKDIIPRCPPLAHPDFTLPFMVATDASATGIGAVLYQEHPESRAARYVQFQARALTKSERNYSATRRELLAIVFALAKYRHFVYGRHFTLFTDHRALVHLRTQPRLNAMLESWHDQLCEYDFTVVHRPGIHNVLPDALSRLFPPPSVEGEGATVKLAVVTRDPAQRQSPARDAPAAQAAPAAPPAPVAQAAPAAAPAPAAPAPAAPAAPDDDGAVAYQQPPPGQRQGIILRHHLRGHFGIKATMDAIREAGYDWPGLRAEVHAACAKCMPCQRHNIARAGYHPLAPISADRPFDHVAIDLAGPFPTSPAANHYLFVLVDVHSRFVILRAIPDKRSATVGAVLFDIFTTFGFPRVVQSDNGAEFVNKVIRDLTSSAKVDHRLITPYHPRANGVAERTVQTATSTIKKMLDGAQNDWDAAVPFAQFAINTKTANIHHTAPFAVMFGRQSNLLDDYSTAISVPATPGDIEGMTRFMQEALFPGIAEISRASQDAMKAAFDAKHTRVSIPTGAHVMVRDVTRRRKLDARYEGPFQVVSVQNGSYTLQDNSGALLPRGFPPSALKLISGDTVQDGVSYEVDRIIDHITTDNGEYEYRVRWKGHTPGDDTWEPAASFDDEDTIAKYWDRRRGAPAAPPVPRLGGSDVVRSPHGMLRRSQAAQARRRQPQRAASGARAAAARRRRVASTAAAPVVSRVRRKPRGAFQARLAAAAGAG
jgi:RNase H-like domain found in reverse transcriptase/Reverse transcriptase (RNA-dependent DNA polymerase)/Integrase core domain/Integrase zinc binding domain/Chromo (CHRromatin Organisation MOdifier) domain